MSVPVLNMRSAAWHDSPDSPHQKNKEAQHRFLIWFLFPFAPFDARSRQVSLWERSEFSLREVPFISRGFLTNAARRGVEREGSAPVGSEMVSEGSGLLLQTKTSPWTLTRTPSGSTPGGRPASGEAWAPARSAPTPSRLSWAPCCGRGPCPVTEACSSSSTWTWRSS